MEWESSYAETQNTEEEQHDIACQTEKLAFADKSCQTKNDDIVIDLQLYNDLLEKSSAAINLRDEIENVKQKCTDLFGHDGTPEMNPEKFEKMCEDAGATKIFPFIFNSLCSERMSKSRQDLNRVRTMVIICMMVYGQSQKANWFQVTLSRTLSQYGISDFGLASLRNVGIAAHPRTVKTASLSAAENHSESVKQFFSNAADNNHFLVFFVDDYHNIHTKHRPSEKKQTQAVHMATLLVKEFKNIKAIPC
eukprot:gene20709-22741_t